VSLAEEGVGEGEFEEADDGTGHHPGCWVRIEYCTPPEGAGCPICPTCPLCTTNGQCSHDRAARACATLAYDTCGSVWACHYD
jgi:hypothetical protein